MNDKVTDQQDGAPHTSDLNDVIADLFSAHRAESVQFTFNPTAGEFRRYSVAIRVQHTRTTFHASGSKPSDVLRRAVRLLKAAKGDGPLRVVDFASVETDGTAR